MLVLLGWTGQKWRAILHAKEVRHKLIDKSVELFGLYAPQNITTI